MNPARPLRPVLAAALAMTLGLGGCVTVFPKVKPSQLYRFDVTAPPAASEAGGGGFAVYRAPTTFAHGAETDRILTLTGSEAAYIAEARWIAPASALFDEAESHAFDQSAGPAHLGRRGELLNAPVSLRLDVEAFEARYLDGASAAPTVVVRVRAGLTRTSDRKLVASRIFESRKKADGNRIGAIVPGFNAAITEVLGQIVDWTNTNGAPQPG